MDVDLREELSDESAGGENPMVEKKEKTAEDSHKLHGNSDYISGKIIRKKITMKLRDPRYIVQSLKGKVDSFETSKLKVSKFISIDQKLSSSGLKDGSVLKIEPMEDSNGIVCSTSGKGNIMSTAQPNTPLQKPSDTSINSTGKKPNRIAKSHILRGVGLRKPKVQDATEIVSPVESLLPEEEIVQSTEKTAVNIEDMESSLGGASTALIESKCIAKSTVLRKSRKSPIQTRPTDDSIIMETGYSNPDSPAERDHHNAKCSAKMSNTKTSKLKKKQTKAGKKVGVLKKPVEDKAKELKKTSIVLEQKKTTETKNVVPADLTDNHEDAPSKKNDAAADKVSTVEKQQFVQAEKVLNKVPSADIAIFEQEHASPLPNSTNQASSSEKQNDSTPDIKKKSSLKRKSSQSPKATQAKLVKSTDESTSSPEHSGLTLPAGWRREVVQRQSGKTAGKFDIYIYSPDGKKLRSRNEVRRYLETAKCSGISAEDFEFSVNRDVKMTARPAEDERSIDQDPTAATEAAVSAKKISKLVDPEDKRASKRQAPAGGFIVKLFSESKKNSKKK